jgi:hypothetical protein
MTEDKVIQYLSRFFLSIATVMIILFVTIAHEKPVPVRMGATVPTVELLQEEYAEHNQTYFYGTLPKDITIKYTDLDKDGNIGEESEAKSGHFTISLDKKTNPYLVMADLTLYHEECHVYLTVNKVSDPTGPHGEAFQGCMLRLAELGAMNGVW